MTFRDGARAGLDAFGQAPPMQKDWGIKSNRR